jgi:MraZ protein
MFRGNSQARVDDKGRLKIPAQYKKVLDEESIATFFVTSMDGKSARIYPLDEWRKLEESFKGSSFDQTKALLKFKVNRYGNEAEIDSQGRLLMPQVLREKAGLVGDVDVVGMTSYLEVMRSERAQTLADQEFTPEQINKLAEWGI